MKHIDCQLHLSPRPDFCNDCARAPFEAPVVDLRVTDADRNQIQINYRSSRLGAEEQVYLTFTNSDQ